MVMSKYEILQQNPTASKRLFGLEMERIDTLLEKVQEHIELQKQQNPLTNRGLKTRMPLADQLLLTLEYLRSYPTFVVLGFNYGVSESWACKIYHRIRPVLAQVVGLKNPDRISYKYVKKVIIDVAVQPIERPVENQETYYNGHKKNT
jgi:Helix-turn-helix of DDE superfamily endonuclease